MNESANFLNAVKLQFLYYKSLGQRAMRQLPEDLLMSAPLHEHINSIPIIVNHLYGNMISRWTDFLTSDGEKNFRDRDQEFELVIQKEEELWRRWGDGWACLEDALNKLDESHLGQLIYIRNQGHTVLEAILRQLTHYAYHVGQIVHLAKELKHDEWESLSIPKGKSQSYNSDKMKQKKRKKHFTSEYLDQDKNKS